MEKPKLSIGEQISHMKNNKGIGFNLISEDDAKKFLTKNNYYFKIKSYAKNYEKYTKGDKKGKYINLEFAYLQELSVLDMYFRRFILRMALDIEHYLKTNLLLDFAKNNKENGYEIIKKLYEKYPYIEKKISAKSNNSACSDLINKYYNNFAIWNIVEVLSFGDFIKLYEMYYEKYPSKASMKSFLWPVRFLRNAAAHNNCLLNSLKIPYERKINPNEKIVNIISKIKGLPKKSKKKMQNPIIHDFVVALYVFCNIVSSEGVKENYLTELKDFVDNRMIRNKDYFLKNQLIVSYYKFIKKILDYFHDLCL